MDVKVNIKVDVNFIPSKESKVEPVKVREKRKKFESQLEEYLSKQIGLFISNKGHVSTAELKQEFGDFALPIVNKLIKECIVILEKVGGRKQYSLPKLWSYNQLDLGG